MRAMTLVAFGALAGCKVVDAPDNLEELVVFGFETFGDARAMEATLDELVPLVDQNEEDLTDGYRVDQLGVEQLELAGIEGAEVSGIVGAMGLIPYRNPVDPVIDVATSPDKAELFEQITEFSATEIGDRACFLAHECESFGQEVFETANVSLLGTSVRHYTHTIFWIEHETFGRVAAIRSLSPDPIEFSSNITRVNQQYGLVYILPDGDGARRVEAFWVDAEVIGLDVPDSFAVDTAINQMGNQAENIDDIIEGISE
ncbi:MAG: hypothetical protein R3F61_00130 [Myxococcota bacterium]